MGEGGGEGESWRAGMFGPLSPSPYPLPQGERGFETIFEETFMPTYEYECGACGHRFEKFQPITAKAIRKCPACGKMKVRRLLGTGGAVLFKGPGFYATDYRSASYKKAAKKEKDSAASASKSVKEKKGTSGLPEKAHGRGGASGKGGE